CESPAPHASRTAVSSRLFFFQAEDGIRDFHMTGVQTCALPISNAAELMDKVGVQVEVVKSAEHKDIGSPFRPMGEGDRVLLDSLIQDVYGQFVETVVEERGLSREQVLAVADGRVISGRPAAALGLVDGSGDQSDGIGIAGRMAGLGSLH